MVRGFLPKAIKGLLILSNNLVIVMGVVVLSIGIFDLIDTKNMTELAEKGNTAGGTTISVQLFNAGNIVLIAVGSIAVFVAMLGCCGAIKENRLILFINYIFLLVLFIGVIIGTAIGFTESIYIIRKPLQDSMPLYNPNSTALEQVEATHVWDDVQRMYGCCGVDDYKDWTGIKGTIFPKSGPGGYMVPESCCETFSASLLGGTVEDCLTSPGDMKYSSKMDGCLKNFGETFDHNSYTIGISTSVMIFFMFLNLVTLFCFALLLHPMDGYNVV